MAKRYGIEIPEEKRNLAEEILLRETKKRREEQEKQKQKERVKLALDNALTDIPTGKDKTKKEYYTFDGNLKPTKQQAKKEYEQKKETAKKKIDSVKIDKDTLINPQQIKKVYGFDGDVNLDGMPDVGFNDKNVQKSMSIQAAKSSKEREDKRNKEIYSYGVEGKLYKKSAENQIHKTNEYFKTAADKKQMLEGVQFEDDFEQYSKYYATNGIDATHEAINRTPSATKKMKNENRINPVAHSGIYDYYYYMDDTERAVYNYYYNKFGKEKARDYLDVIDRIIDKRRSAAETQEAYEQSKEHPEKSFGQHAMMGLTSLHANVETATQNISNLVTGEDVPVNIYAPTFSGVAKRGAISEGLTENKGTMESLLISTGLSMADMAVSLPFGSAAAPFIMSSNAAAEAAYDATKRGASAGQALASGIASGAAEYFAERLPIENLFKIAKMPKSGFKKYAAEIAKQAHLEGSEEFITQIINNISDSLIMGEKSNYNMRVLQYVGQGMTKKEAEKSAFIDIYIKESAMAYAGGAISGGFFGTAGSVKSAASDTKTPPSTEMPKGDVQSDTSNVNSEPVSTEQPKGEARVTPHVMEYEQVRRAKLSQKTGKAIDTPVLTEHRKLTHIQRKLINDAKKAGLDVTFFKSTSKDYDVADIGVNGSYLNGHIYINVNAENPYSVVLGHEVVHQMKETDIESYNKLVNIVRNELGADSNFDSLTGLGQEEAVADIMGDIIADPKKYRRIFEQDVTFGQRVLDYINGLIERFKASTANENGYVSEYTRKLLKARDQLTKIMADSVVNMKDKTDVQHSGDIDINNSMQYNNVEELLKKDGIIYGSDIHNSTRISGISDELGNQGRGDKANKRNVPGTLAENDIQTQSGEVNNNKEASNIGGSKGNSGVSVERVPRYPNEDETSHRLTGNKATDDRRYFEAINSNEDLARQMLLEKAQQEGFVPVNMYHGTTSKEVFIKFKADNAIWVTPDLDYAEGYTSYQDFGNGDADIRKQLHTVNGSNVYDLFVKADKILDVGNIEKPINNINELYNFADSIGFGQDEILNCWKQGRQHESNSLWTITNTPLFAECARKYGYDALKAVEGNGVTSYGILYKGNVKSAKTVTYDDNKNIIPLSERFNTKKDDIRHSTMKGKGKANANADVIDESRKVDSILRGERTKFIKKLAEIMNIPASVNKDVMKPLFNEAWQQYKAFGELTPQMIDNIFEKAYENGRIINDEFYNTYKGLKDEIKNTKFTISEQDKSDIPDLSDLRRRRVIRIGEEGIAIDSKYIELSERYPELFPADITHPADQLLKIAEVADSIRITETNMADYADGAYAEDFKEYMRNEFNNSFDTVLKQFKMAGRYINSVESKNKASEEATALTVKDVIKLHADKTSLQRNYDKLAKREFLTDEDNVALDQLVRGKKTFEQLDPDLNIAGIKKVYEAKKALDEVQTQVDEYKKQVRKNFSNEAKSLIETSDDWKDVSGNLLLNLNTQERNMEIIIPDANVAKKFNDTVFAPVSKANADAVRLINKYCDKIASLKLNETESNAVQFLGEVRTRCEELQSVKKKSEEVKNEISELEKREREFLRDNKGLNTDKVAKAITVFRKSYDELWELANETLVANGEDPIPYRKHYFPHFGEDGSDAFLGKLKEIVGIDANVSELPADIAGRTDTFKPNKTWFGHAMQRKGEQTVYDAVTGFQKYIVGIADVIYQTENIKRLRAIESELRAKYSDAGVKEALQEIYESNLSNEDKVDRIQEIKKRKLSKLNGLVSNLVEYTNIIANKKSKYDRLMEDGLGRWVYNVTTALDRNIRGNLVAKSFTSAVKNLSPIPLASKDIPNKYFVNGFKSFIFDKDDLKMRSDFLVNRKGIRKITTSLSDKLDMASDLAIHVDTIVSNVVLRAKYIQNIDAGMSETDALKDANEYAKRIIAGRAKGEQPVIYYARNPLIKIFTGFQLENYNQYANLLHDMPRELKNKFPKGHKDKFAKALLGVIIKYTLTAFLFNESLEKLIGSPAIFDPIGASIAVYEALTGNVVPNIFDAIFEGDRIVKSEKDAKQRLTNLRDDIIGEIPYVGAYYGGRYPIKSALPDFELIKSGFENLANNEGNIYSNISDIATGAAPITYLAKPVGVGANQLLKTIKGIKTVAEGGEYDNKGNLKFAVEQTPWNYTKGALGGPSALDEKRKYYEEGRSSLSDSENEEYLRRVEANEVPVAVYGDITNRRKTKETVKMSNMFYRVMNEGKVYSLVPEKDKAVYNEVINLQKQLDDNNIKGNVMFGVPDESYEYDGKKYTLHTKEYEKYVDSCSKKAMQGLRDLTDTIGYKNADAKTKAKLISDVYEYSRAKARAEMSTGYEKSETYKEHYAKTALAEKKKIAPGDYIGFKAALPEKYNEGDAYRIAIKNGFDEDEAELLVNLSKNYSAEQCERIDKAGGFKYAKVVRKLYSDMKSNGYDCNSLYAPVADDTFSYKNKKAGINYEVKLNEKQSQTLQNMYIGVYEKELDKIAKRRYGSLNDYYKAVKKCRDKARDASNEAFYYWLKRQ